MEHVGTSIEPIIAWRKWRANPHDGLLRSLFKGMMWVPRQRAIARCTPDRGPMFAAGRACEYAPREGHTCGIWGVRTRDDLPQYGEVLGGRLSRLSDHLIVVGRVSLWGDYVEHERGWRAQYAYPYALEVLARPRIVMPYESEEEQQQEAWEVALKLRELYLVDCTVRS